MVRLAIAFVLSNFTVVLLVLWLVASLIALASAPKPLTGAAVVEKLLAWFVFFNIGVSYLYNFVVHGFFGEMTARFIGWANSLFQFEVATASLGFAAVGFLAAFRSFDLCLAAILGPGLFTLPAAPGHICEMSAAYNFAPGNAGVILYTDIGIPLLGFLLLWLQPRFARPGQSASA
ncbi:MAG: hypothetical protein P8Y71_13115 [Pseudolabrys sp.]